MNTRPVVKRAGRPKLRDRTKIVVRSAMIERASLAQYELQRELMSALNEGGSRSWTPVDVSSYFAAGAAEVVPSIYERSDGVRLLYPGLLHVFYGPSESGKSWLALSVCAEQVRQGHHVMYLDFEDSFITMLDRLRMLGVPDKEIKARFHYFQPDGPLNEAVAKEFVDLAGIWKPTVVVVDAITEAMAVHGMNPNSDVDVASVMRRFPKPLAAAGAAVVMIDHVNHTHNDRATGSQHKKASVDVQIQVAALRKMTRGEGGSLAITVTKDRQGWLREQAGEKASLGTVTFTAIESDQLNSSWTPRGVVTPDSEVSAPKRDKAVEEIRRWLEGLDPGSWVGPTAIREGVRKMCKGEDRAAPRNDTIPSAITVLVAEGVLIERRKKLKGESERVEYALAGS